MFIYIYNYLELLLLTEIKNRKVKLLNKKNVTGCERREIPSSFKLRVLQEA